MSIRTSISRVPQQSPDSRLEQVLRIGTSFYPGEGPVQRSDEEVSSMLAQLDRQLGFMTFRVEHAFSEWVSETEVRSVVNVWIGAQNGVLGTVEYNFGQMAWVPWLVNGESCGQVNMFLTENRLHELRRILNKSRADVYDRLKIKIQERALNGGRMLIDQKYPNTVVLRHNTGNYTNHYKGYEYEINTSGIPSTFDWDNPDVSLMPVPLVRQNAYTIP